MGFWGACMCTCRKKHVIWRDMPIDAREECFLNSKLLLESVRQSLELARAGSGSGSGSYCELHRS